MPIETWQRIHDQLSEPFADVKWRLQQVTPKDAKGTDGKYRPEARGLFMAYIDARDVYDRLDAVVGFGCWKRTITQVNADGSVVGCIAIRLDGDWFEHEDIGYPNNPGAAHETEPLKAAASDAFKRAAVGLGIGRFLYELPAEWVAIDERGKATVDLNRKFANGRVSSPEAPQQTEPLRDKSTSVNTAGSVPVADEAPPQTVTDWTVFWKWSRKYGLKEKVDFEKAVGSPLGHDPGFAFERLMAWREAATYQPAMPS